MSRSARFPIEEMCTSFLCFVKGEKGKLKQQHRGHEAPQHDKLHFRFHIAINILVYGGKGKS